jgi:imidazolonepropionase-like amidohydrolase
LKHGITSFRDPGHPFRFYDAVMRSNKQLPRIFLSGAHLDADPPVFPDQAIVIQNANHARRTVNEHVDRGASVIKVYFGLPLEHIHAACEAARGRGVLVTAHLELVDADDAIRAGVRGIEHVTSFGTALAEPKEAQQFKSNVYADSKTWKKLRHRLWANLDLDSSPRVESLLDQILAKGVFVSPTLALFERRAGKRRSTSIEVEGFANMLRFVGLCHEAGAKVVVGSHTDPPLAKTGRGYQRELELLVEAGLTPLEAITAGTLHSAQFLGIDTRLGTLEAGKAADLILVEGDPSRDLAAMEKVRSVMLNGIWVGRSP